jgi:putative endonuclease
MMASKKGGAIYIGVTSNLIKRAYEHKTSATFGFTERYKAYRLVYFESYQDINDAILREKKLKHYKREWKIELIEKENPEWNDLYQKLF